MISFEKLIEDKDISYVPIYSMFSHKNGKINLTCDGNVNRWMTVLSKNKNSGHQIRIFGPNEDTCLNWKEFQRKLKKVDCSIRYIKTQLIRKSASVQRTDVFGNQLLKDFASELLFSKYPFERHLIIAEGQGLLRGLLATRTSFNSYRDRQFSTFDRIQEFPEIAFWCPVCQTNKKTRSFFGKDDKEENEKLFREVDYVIVATKDQLEYLEEIKIPKKKIVYSPEFIDRSLDIFKDYDVDKRTIECIRNFGKHVIYLPFRLSDEGYKIWEIIETLNNFPSIKVICPNVNGSSEDEIANLCSTRSKLREDEIKSFFDRMVHVDSSRDTYYSILDNCNNVIIPYFEDIDFVMHAAVDELMRGTKKPICKVVQTKEKLIEELEK